VNRHAHWNTLYQSKRDEEMSWTQSEAELSLRLIGAVCPAGHVIDVGGGNSILAARLVERGYTVTVLDIAESALERARARMQAAAEQVRWIAADITAEPLLPTCDVWHDRAVFHFLTEAADRAAYCRVLERTLPAGGHAVIATFALDGPERCSGLPVQRYDSSLLATELGARFELLQSLPQTHTTPQGKSQSFQFNLFRRF
jgi:ubiquinone/menaquinone biosynthesis C-methylase UbiE